MHESRWLLLVRAFLAFFEEIAIPHYVEPAIMSSEPRRALKPESSSSKKSPNYVKMQEMLSEEAKNDDSLRSSLASTTRIHRKPWPSKKASEAEESVKFMSHIPKYLQREESDYSIQEKALSVGVLNWKRLQLWSENDKLSQSNISNSSSPFSTFNSSSLSSRSKASPAERKLSPAFNSISASLTEKDQKRDKKNDSSRLEVNEAPSASKRSENFALLSSNASKKVSRLDELEKLRRSIDHESGPKDKRKHLEEIIARSILSFDNSLLDQGNNPRKASGGTSSGNLSLPPRPSSPPPSSREALCEAFLINEHNKIALSQGEKELLPIVLPKIDPNAVSGSSLNEPVGRSTSRGKRSPMLLFFDQPRKSTSSAGSISDNPELVVGRSSSRGKVSPANANIPDISRSTSRGKRSPLRQMLESPRKSSSIPDPPPNESSSADPIHSPLTRQALLKVCRKNGLPLLMFSSRNDSILVATMNRRGNSDMNICDSVYEIHTAASVEVKKKNAAWLSQGTRSKKPGFSCKFVAELIVSSSERVSFDLTHRSFIRELVLLGDELIPSNRDENDDRSSGTELAAIVVESHRDCGCNVCSPRITAILPSGVHGLSNSKKPLKLLERWESRGSCDCGGWDEGCALTILTNSLKQMDGSKSVHDHGARPTEKPCESDLFTEGDARKGKSSFSMVSFKEDMYTVEFKSSIPLLQAFSISIAMLHDRNHLIEVDTYEDINFDAYPPFSS